MVDVSGMEYSDDALQRLIETAQKVGRRCERTRLLAMLQTQDAYYVTKGQAAFDKGDIEEANGCAAGVTVCRTLIDRFTIRDGVLPDGVEKRPGLNALKAAAKEALDKLSTMMGGQPLSEMTCDCCAKDYLTNEPGLTRCPACIEHGQDDAQKH
jgi:hypothetical protein